MKNKNIFNLFEIPLSTLNLNQTLKYFKTPHPSSGYVCFVNVHTITESTQNNALQNALQNAMLCAPDGLPLVWISKIFSKKRKIKSRVCGPDFMHFYLLQNPNEEYGFIGSNAHTIEKIIHNYKLKNSVHLSPPHETFTEKRALQQWKEFEFKCKELNVFPNKIWIGLGAPKQELWMNVIQKKVNPKNTLFFGVGAAFDFLSLQKKRAPSLLQKLGLEWLFRLLQEPQRLIKRYLYTNSIFIFKILSSIREIKRVN